MIRTIEELAELVGRTVALKQAGKRYVGRCPFHGPDRHPSFNLFTGRDGKPRFCCMACGQRGDAWDWMSFIGETGTFKPDPEIKRARLELQRREKAINAFRDRNPDCSVPDWFLDV